MSHAPAPRHPTDQAVRRRRLSGMAVLAAGLLSVGLGSDGDRSSPAASNAAGPPLGPAAGAVRFVKHTEPDFDRFTRNARHARWMQRRFWRMTTFSPYFDSRLRWYGSAWVYRDDLLMSGVDRTDARERVRDQVDDVLQRWRRG